MSAGTPNYEQVAKGLIETNNRLRAKLGMEPRDHAALSWQRVADEVREENKKLAEEVENPPKKRTPVASRRGRRPKNEVKEEEAPKEEQEEKTADTDESAK